MNAHGRIYQSAMDAQRFDLKARKRPASTEIPCVNFNETRQGKITTKKLTRSTSAPELQRADYPSPGSSRYLFNGNFTNKEATNYTDVFEHADGSTTTRTIISPHPTRKLNFNCISDPSQENLGTGQGLLKTGSCLNCFRADAFEDGETVVKEMIEDRKKHLSGARGFTVSMHVEREVTTEEKWRSAVESILYEKSGRAVDSVTSRVEIG